MDEHEPEEQSEQDASTHSASAQVPLEKKAEAIEQTPVADVDSTRDQAPEVVSSLEQAPDVDSSREQAAASAQDAMALRASVQDPSVKESMDDKPEPIQQEPTMVVDSSLEQAPNGDASPEQAPNGDASPEQAIVEVNIVPVEPEKTQETGLVEESQILPGTSESAVEPEMVVLEVTEQAVEIETEEETPAVKPRASSVLSSGRRSSQLAQGELPPEASSEPAWYVIHCYSGYENKVRHNLEQRIETMGMKDRIFDVVIPTQEEIEVREGKRRTVERHIFPGYVLVNMTLSEESWYVVRNTPGVTGFVGMGNLPTALRPEEVSSIVKRMEADAPTVKVSFKEGERVRIIDGPFNDFRGTVAEIDVERTKVRVMVSFFGRETPVELDFLQVEKA